MRKPMILAALAASGMLAATAVSAQSYDQNIRARAPGPTGLSQGANDSTNPVFEGRRWRGGNGSYGGGYGFGGSYGYGQPYGYDSYGYMPPRRARRDGYRSW